MGTLKFVLFVALIALFSTGNTKKLVLFDGAANTALSIDSINNTTNIDSPQKLRLQGVDVVNEIARLQAQVRNLTEGATLFPQLRKSHSKAYANSKWEPVCHNRCAERRIKQFAYRCVFINVNETPG